MFDETKIEVSPAHGMNDGSCLLLGLAVKADWRMAHV